MCREALVPGWRRLPLLAAAATLRRRRGPSATRPTDACWLPSDLPLSLALLEQLAASLSFGASCRGLVQLQGKRRRRHRRRALHTLREGGRVAICVGPAGRTRGPAPIERERIRDHRAAAEESGREREQGSPPSHAHTRTHATPHARCAQTCQSLHGRNLLAHASPDSRVQNQIFGWVAAAHAVTTRAKQQDRACATQPTPSIHPSNQRAQAAILVVVVHLCASTRTRGSKSSGVQSQPPNAEVPRRAQRPRRREKQVSSGVRPARHTVGRGGSGPRAASPASPAKITHAIKRGETEITRGRRSREKGDSRARARGRGSSAAHAHALVTDARTHSTSQHVHGVTLTTVEGHVYSPERERERGRPHLDARSGPPSCERSPPTRARLCCASGAGPKTKGSPRLPVAATSSQPQTRRPHGHWGPQRIGTAPFPSPPPHELHPPRALLAPPLHSHVGAGRPARAREERAGGGGGGAGGGGGGGRSRAICDPSHAWGRARALLEAAAICQVGAGGRGHQGGEGAAPHSRRVRCVGQGGRAGKAPSGSSDGGETAPFRRQVTCTRCTRDQGER